MIAWLYTEDDEPLTDGPFFSLADVPNSFLWKFTGACLWIEEQTPRGWFYENALWTDQGWLTTSRGVRPAELVRPSFLLAATAL